MKNLTPEWENIIEDITNLFRLKKELNHTGVKDIKIFLKKEKETKAIKNTIIRDIKNLFEHEKENYYKPVRVNNFWSSNYIEYESYGDIN